METLNPLHKQKGATMWMLLTGASLVVLFMLIAIKLIPAYLDNNKIISALESLAETPGVNNYSRRQVLDKIDNTLYIDMASNLLDLKEALAISKTNTHKVYTISYERVIPMAFNISALLDFENSVEVPLK